MKVLFRNCLGVLAWVFLIGTAAAQPLSWQKGAGFREAAVTVSQTGKTGFTEVLAQTGIRFTNFLSIRLYYRNYQYWWQCNRYYKRDRARFTS